MASLDQVISISYALTMIRGAALIGLAGSVALCNCAPIVRSGRLQEGSLTHHFDGSPQSDEAWIAEAVRSHPELRGFRSGGLPPRTVEVHRERGEVYVGFIEWGSGRPGIVDARCFRISGGIVASSGEFHTPIGQRVDRIELFHCQPIPGK